MIQSFLGKKIFGLQSDQFSEVGKNEKRPAVWVEMMFQAREKFVKKAFGEKDGLIKKGGVLERTIIFVKV